MARVPDEEGGGAPAGDHFASIFGHEVELGTAHTPKQKKGKRKPKKKGKKKEEKEEEGNGSGEPSSGDGGDEGTVSDAGGAGGGGAGGGPGEAFCGGEESGGRSCCGDGGCGETGGGGVCCDCGEGERTVGETVGEDGGVCFGGEERDESIKHKHESPLHDAARKKKNIKSKRKK